MNTQIFWTLALGWLLWRALRYAQARRVYREQHVSKEFLRKLNQEEWADHPRLAYSGPPLHRNYVRPFRALGKEKAS